MDVFPHAHLLIGHHWWTTLLVVTRNNCCIGKIAQSLDRTHDLFIQRQARYPLLQRAKPTGKGRNHSGQSQNILLHSPPPNLCSSSNTGHPPLQRGSGIIPIHTKSLSLPQHSIPGIGRFHHFGCQCCRRKFAQAGDQTHDLFTQRQACYPLCQRDKPTGKGSNHPGQSQNTLLHNQFYNNEDRQLLPRPHPSPKTVIFDFLDIDSDRPQLWC